MSNHSPSVSLLFPPLVETSLGAIYPSTAVLAAYLEQADVSTEQLDLNGDFADFILNRDVLKRLGEGVVKPIDRHSLAAACARWILVHRDKFIDESDRHLFGEGNPHSWALNAIASSFRFDPSLEEIVGGEMPEEVERLLEEFYDTVGVSERISPEVLLVGISAPMGPQLLPSLWLAQRIKRDRPELRVVLGGPSVSLMDSGDLEQILSGHPAVDAAVRFDGEGPLLALSQQATAGDWRPEEVPSVASLVDGSFHDVTPVPGPQINLLPHPRYDRKIVERLARPVLSVTQARGCYWGKCDYCDFVELYGVSQPYRGRRPDLVADEMEALTQQFGVTRFEIVTESIPPAFARRLAKELADREMDIHWDSFAMADRRFDNDLMVLIAQSGCQYLTIGLETMVGRVLDLVHKSADPAENARFMRAARDAGLPLRINLIPDLPSTTYDEAVEGLEAMREFTDCFDVVAIWPFEGTRSSNIGRHPDKFGLRVVEPELDPSLSTAQYAMNRLRYVDDAMTDEQRREVIRRYREFAVEVNDAIPTRPDISDGARCRIAPDSELDVVWDGDRLVLTAVATMTRIALRPEPSRRLAPFLKGQTFSLDQLGRLGSELASRGILQVLEHEHVGMAQ